MNKVIMHIVGNRPQLIKLAPVSKALNKIGYHDIIVHTGQHYDTNMSDVFFEELGIAQPVLNLHIGSGTHAEMTARALVGLEKAIQKYDPVMVVLYGDTDSTLAGAIAASKLCVPITHVEAGPRTRSSSNPEELNRVMVDHVSTLLCAPDQQSVTNLKSENVFGKIIFSGDVMYDIFLEKVVNSKDELYHVYGCQDKKYILMTWHRQENTSSPEIMKNILTFIAESGETFIFPIHPRTKKSLENFGLIEMAEKIPGLIMIDPVGYDEMVELQKHCKMIVTDSGGLSKESYFAGVRCLFMVNIHVWEDLVRIHWIENLDVANRNSIQRGIELLRKEDASKEIPDDQKEKFFGNGHAADAIANEIRVYLENEIG